MWATVKEDMYEAIFYLFRHSRLTLNWNKPLLC